ncbi:uncharacterized protein LOC121586198 [Coregonus clupeaformis]|uniref:uncharacterized protein LOC121586198 n=1 Tax=Coregonus clupeaformis TaxID=59861 RepID=UPI001BE0760B|nr:uncharacterized protein LOC121586198 [Coregonus clupeaformis]
MSKIELLREFLKQKLTAAAEEIFGVVEKTIAEYQVDVFRTKEENERLRGLLMLHRGESDCQQQAEATITLVQVAPEQQSCTQDWSLRLGQEDPEPTVSQCKGEEDTHWIKVEEHIQRLESDSKEDPDQVSTPEDFTFQMEAEGSADQAIKLKVIINDNRIEKVVLPSQPDSLNELISTLKEKLHLKFDFCLLYEDPDFNNELFNLETIEDLPSPRATVKVLPIRRDTDLGLAGLSATELQDAPPERLGRWPEVFVIPTFSMEVEFALREGNCAYLRHETVLKITKGQKHNILDRMAWTIFNSKAYPSDRQFAKAAEALVTKHPCLKEPGSRTGCDGWKNSLKFKMGNYRQKLRRVGFPEVAVNGVRSSKHHPDNEHARSNIKRARRAEVNFLPNFPQGEDEASLEKQRLEMVHEITKENRDLPLWDPEPTVSHCKEEEDTHWISEVEEHIQRLESDPKDPDQVSTSEESDCQQQAEATITLVQVAPEQQSCTQDWSLRLGQEDPEPTVSQCKGEEDTHWIKVEEHIQRLESDSKEDPDQVSTPEDFTFQMEAEGSADQAIKLKVIINDNRIEKVVLPSQPDSLNELISTLKEKLHLKFDFCLLYEDPDFNNELFNLETIEDLPSPRATVKVLPIRRDTDLGLAGLSATELQDAPPERLDFTFQMETADQAIKLKVIISDNRIERVVLPSQPDSLNELISTLKEKLHLKFDFCLLYEDPDFNNELFNLETIEDLPSPRATVTVLPIRRDTDLGLAGLSATELQDAPPERLGRWPEVFVIPTFSMEVEFALREGNCAYLRHETVLKITRDQKHNILDRMAWTIFNFKAYPSDRQFAKAAEALVTKHPCLKEPGSRTGCDGWKNSLKFKMGNYRQKLRRVGFPEVTVNGGRRSKHRPDNEHARSNIKRARRAEVNFLPNFPQGEDEASLEKQRLEMVHEITKENRDLPLINQHMQKTFALRRQEIVKSSPPVEHLRTRWPALFLEAQVHAEFQRITNQSLQQTFYAALDHHTPRLLTLFREKEGKSTTYGGKFSSILRVYNEQFTSQGEKNITGARSAVLAGLPLLLREDSSDVFKVCKVGELSNPGILDGVSILSVVAQHNEVVVGGVPIRPAHVSIVLEDKIVMTNSRSWPDALVVVFGLLYSLHLNYPKALGSTFEFMQKVFLNLDDGKLKPKLLALKNELLA